MGQGLGEALDPEVFLFTQILGAASRARPEVLCSDLRPGLGLQAGESAIIPTQGIPQAELALPRVPSESWISASGRVLGERPKTPSFRLAPHLPPPQGLSSVCPSA